MSSHNSSNENDFSRTHLSAQNVAKSSSTQNTAFKVEYKEYSFQTNPNKNIENKVAAFWKELGGMKPPKLDFFKPPQITECFEKTDYEDDTAASQKNKYKWTNTYCLFKKRGLKQAAINAVPDECPMCNNKAFPPLFADEKCLEMIKDYANEDETESSNY